MRIQSFTLYVKILASNMNFEPTHENFDAGHQAWVIKMISKTMHDGESYIFRKKFRIK